MNLSGLNMTQSYQYILWVSTGYWIQNIRINLENNSLGNNSGDAEMTQIDPDNLVQTQKVSEKYWLIDLVQMFGQKMKDILCQVSSHKTLSTMDHISMKFIIAPFCTAWSELVMWLITSCLMMCKCKKMFPSHLLRA